MDIIGTGIGITKTIRNVGRFKEIATVFGRNGFDELLNTGIGLKIPGFIIPKSSKNIREELKNKSEKDWNQIIGSRLAKCFEELGPAFIKFGQLVSSREDIFDSAFIDEMKKLRDKVAPVSFSVLKKDVENSLGKKIEDVFKNIEDTPIGMASIGVVFRGELLDGSNVVLKVRRPNIEKIIETDFSILEFIVGHLEKVSDELKYLGLSRMIKDFGLGLQNELNFNMEGLNCQRLKKNLKAHDTNNVFYLPIIYKDISSISLLVMEELKGIPFSDDRIKEDIDNVKEKLFEGVKLFSRTFLQDGFFHADLHGGNFFLLENGQIGLIDFGLMGTLGKKSRNNFIAIIYAIITYNYENLVYEFLDVADYDEIPDIESLISDIRDCLSPFIGLTVKQTNFSVVLQSIVNTMKKHQLYLPRDWYIVFRALITLDGVGKSMGIDFDIFSIMEDDIKDIAKHSFSKDEVLEEAIWASRDLISSIRVVPRHLKWFTREFAKKGYAFEIQHKGLESTSEKIVEALIFLGITLLSSVFIISGVLTLDQDVMSWRDVPIISWVFWGLGLISVARGMKLIGRV